MVEQLVVEQTAQLMLERTFVEYPMVEGQLVE